VCLLSSGVVYCVFKASFVANCCLKVCVHVCVHARGCVCVCVKISMSVKLQVAENSPCTYKISGELLSLLCYKWEDPQTPLRWHK